jgi:hypothetical protein
VARTGSGYRLAARPHEGCARLLVEDHGRPTTTAQVAFPQERLLISNECACVAVLHELVSEKRICQDYRLRFPVETANHNWMGADCKSVRLGFRWYIGLDGSIASWSVPRSEPCPSSP